MIPIHEVELIASVPSSSKANPLLRGVQILFGDFVES